MNISTLPMDMRSNLLLSQKVEVGLVFQEMLGIDDAAEYMIRNGVPIHVIQRVLTRPSERRTQSAFSHARM